MSKMRRDSDIANLMMKTLHKVKILSVVAGPYSFVAFGMTGCHGGRWQDRAREVKMSKVSPQRRVPWRPAAGFGNTFATVAREVALKLPEMKPIEPLRPD